jgi:hypothetical protein
MDAVSTSEILDFGETTRCSIPEECLRTSRKNQYKELTENEI